MGQENEPVKSPFMKNIKVIRAHTNNKDMLEELFGGFETICRTYESEGVKLPDTAAAIYVGGVMMSLKAVGFANEDSERLGIDLMKIIEIAGLNTCDCENCVRNREKIAELKKKHGAA